jgi:hypothetical protein
VRGKNYNAGLRGVLFEARHYARMGQAVWLFGWLVLRETREREGIGFVLGGRPVSYSEIEEETGFARKSLQRWMQALRRGGYIETTTAPGGIIVRIQKAKKFLRPSSTHGAGSFQQGRGRNVEKLWKSSETAQPLLKFADPHRRNEEGCPQICGGPSSESAEKAALAKGIGSGGIERQIVKKLQLPLDAHNTENASAETLSHHNYCSEGEKPANAKSQFPFAQFAARPAVPINNGNISRDYEETRRSRRHEEISRELRVGSGPEVPR